MSIDEFIKIVAPKLKTPTLPDFTYMSGKDLKLTGYGQKGNQINDNEMYKVPIPAVMRVDHRFKLRMAWLRGGKPAVRTYLLKYLEQDAVDEITKVL